MSIQEILAEIPKLDLSDCARIKLAAEKRLLGRTPRLSDLLDPILDNPDTLPLALPDDLASNPAYLANYGR